MTNTPKMATDDLNRLVEIRRTIGTLRRALAPHREVVVSLSHPELDRLSTELEMLLSGGAEGGGSYIMIGRKRG